MLWTARLSLALAVLLAVPPPSDASPLSTRERQPASERPWPYGTGVPTASANRDDDEAAHEDDNGSRSKTAVQGGYVYEGERTFEEVFPRDEAAASLSEEDDGSESGEESDESDEDSGEGESDEGEENSQEEKDEEKENDKNESKLDTDEKANEVVPERRVPSFFKIVSRVTSSTSSVGSPKAPKLKGASQPPLVTELANKNSPKLEDTTDPKSSVTSTKNASKNFQDSRVSEPGSQLSEPRKSAYDHFLRVPKISEIKSQSKQTSDVEVSRPSADNEKADQNEREPKNSVENKATDTSGISFFTIANHGSSSFGENRDHGSGKRYGAKDTAGDDDDETKSKEKKEESESHDNENEDEGSDEEEETEDSDEDSSEEDDGLPAFIVLREQGGDSIKADLARESAKHFSASKITYKTQKDISEEKLLFLPVIDGKDLSVSAIRALSSQFSKRGEPIHLEYRELKEGVEGYVAELGNKETDHFISKLMQLLVAMDDDPSSEAEMLNSKDVKVNENFNRNVFKNVYSRGRNSETSEKTTNPVLSHFQLPGSQSSLKNKVSSEQAAVGQSLNVDRLTTTKLTASEVAQPDLSGQKGKSGRNQATSFFRIESATEKTLEGIRSHDSINKKFPSARIPIEISPIRPSSNPHDQSPRLKIKAEIVHSTAPDSQRKATIKISEEEIKAITNRYAKFLENYRNSKNLSETTSSQILRESQAQEYANRKNSSPHGQRLTGTRGSNTHESGKTMTVEIVTAVPVSIDEFKGEFPGEAQVNENIQVAKPVEATLVSSHKEKSGDSRTSALGRSEKFLNHDVSDEIDLVPFTAPNTVRANKVQLIAGAISNTGEADSSSIAIPSKPIVLNPTVGVAREHETLLGSSSLLGRFMSNIKLESSGVPAGARREGLVREVIRHRLMNILNARQNETKSNSSANFRFELEELHPSQLPIEILSRMQASRLSNQGIRLASPTAQDNSDFASDVSLQITEPGVGLPSPLAATSQSKLTPDATKVSNAEASSFSTFNLDSPTLDSSVDDNAQLVKFSTSHFNHEGDQEASSTLEPIEIINDSIKSQEFGVPLLSSLPHEQFLSTASIITQDDSTLSQMLGSSSHSNGQVAGGNEDTIQNSNLMSFSSINDKTDTPAENLFADALFSAGQAATVEHDASAGTSFSPAQPEVDFATVNFDAGFEQDQGVATVSGVASVQQATDSFMLSEQADISTGTAILDEGTDVGAELNISDSLQSFDFSGQSELTHVNGGSVALDTIQIPDLTPETVFDSFSALTTFVEEIPSDFAAQGEEISIPEQNLPHLVENAMPANIRELDGLTDSQDFMVEPDIVEFGNVPEFQDTPQSPDNIIPPVGLEEKNERLLEIGAQLENLPGQIEGEKPSFASTSSVQEENNGDVKIIEQEILDPIVQPNTIGKSLLQDSVVQDARDPLISAASDDRRNSTLQQRLNARLMQMIKEQAENITRNSTATALPIFNSLDDGKDAHPQEKEIQVIQHDRVETNFNTGVTDSEPKLATISMHGESLVNPPSQIGKAKTETPDEFSELRSSHQSNSTLEEELQKRFKSRLMQMIRERAEAMNKKSVDIVPTLQVHQDSIAAPDKVISEPKFEVEFSASPVLESKTSIVENEMAAPKVTEVTPKIEHQVTIIENLGPSISSSHQGVEKTEENGTTGEAETKISVELQDELNARLMEMIQGRKQPLQKSLNVSADSSRKSHVSITEATESEILTNTTFQTFAGSTIPEEPEILSSPKDSISNFMVDQLNSDIRTESHPGGEDKPAIENSSPATPADPNTVEQQSGVVNRKIELDRIITEGDLSHRFNDMKTIIEKHVEPEVIVENATVDAAREGAIQDRLNNKLMEILRKRMEETGDVKTGKELGTTVETSVTSINSAQRGTTPDSGNRLTIEQLISGVEEIPADDQTLITNDSSILSSSRDGDLAVKNAAELPVLVDSPNVQELPGNQLQSFIASSVTETIQQLSEDISATISTSGNQDVTDLIKSEAEEPTKVLTEGIALKPLRIIRLDGNIPSADVTSKIEFSPRPEPSTPLDARSSALLGLPSGVPQNKNIRVLTQEQFLSHFQGIENQRLLSQLPETRPLVRTSNGRGALGILQSFGVGGNVVEASRQSFKDAHDVLKRPDATRKLLPASPVPIFTPEFPNARGARLISKVEERNLLSTDRSRVPTQFAFEDPSIDSQLIQLAEQNFQPFRQLQKSLSHTETSPIGVVPGDAINNVKPNGTNFIVIPEEAGIRSVRPSVAKETLRQRSPVIKRAKLFSTHEIPSNSSHLDSRNVNALINQGSQQFALETNEQEANTVKVPLMFSKTMPIFEVPPTTTSRRNQFTVESTSTVNLGSSQPQLLSGMPQPLPFAQPQEIFRLSKTQHPSSGNLKSSNNLSAFPELANTPNQRLSERIQPDQNIRKVSSTNDESDIVTVRSQSGRLFTIPRNLFQGFLQRSDNNARKERVLQARTLIQTLFVDEEHESRLKRKTPAETIHHEQLLDKFRSRRLINGNDHRMKRDVKEKVFEGTAAQTNLESNRRSFSTLETGNSEEVATPKVIFGSEGTYLVDGSGKKIFLEKALNVFYH